MFNQVHLTALAGMKSFSFGDFFMTNQDSGCPLGEEAMRKRLRGLVKSTGPSGNVPCGGVYHF